MCGAREVQNHACSDIGAPKELWPSPTHNIIPKPPIVGDKAVLKKVHQSCSDEDATAPAAAKTKAKKPTKRQNDSSSETSQNIAPELSPTGTTTSSASGPLVTETTTGTPPTGMEATAGTPQSNNRTFRNHLHL